MAVLLGLDKVCLEYAHKTIFKDLTISIHSGDCIGIVGKNGEGKSSLLKLFAQEIEADSGRQLISSGVELSYLGQSDKLIEDKSLQENLFGDQPEYIWASDPKIRSIVDALLGDINWDLSVKHLSGGQRRRLDLARCLIAPSEVLLLDEPTNHLDIAGINWLAQHLRARFKTRQGALLLVSHDRWFLDELCQSMWEVHDAAVSAYEGGYSAYILQRVERERLEEQAYLKRRNIARKELAWLSRGARARSTKPKFHVKKALEIIEHDPPLRNSLELKASAISRLGKQVIEFSGLSFAYPGAQPLINQLDFLIGPGDRIGIIGANGAGKSSLFELIQGKLQANEGHIKLGKTVKLKSLSQSLDELTPYLNSRVKELLAEYKTSYTLGNEELSPTQLLERLGFESGQLMTYIKDLSGGQKRRLQIMLTLLDKPNVLLLDEPGNDLDTDMLALLEDTFDLWPGTLLLITHDRYLMERMTDMQYALLDGKLVHLPAGVDQYLELLDEQNKLKDALSHKQLKLQNHKDLKDQSLNTSESDKSVPKKALKASELREIKKKRDSLERKISTAEKHVLQQKELLEKIDPSAYIELLEQQNIIKDCEERLATLEEQWLELEQIIELEENY